MMTRIVVVLVALWLPCVAQAQQALNMTLLGQVPYNDQLSALRGVAHNGREYAVVGTYQGLSFVDVTDPANPVEVYFHPGPQSIWREPYTYNGHAYTVSEGGAVGLQMIDMGPLPGGSITTTGEYHGTNFPFNTGHTMFIDENGVAYIFGSDYGVGGAIFLDLSDPMNPVELGVWDQYYIHDGYVRNDTLWAACIQNGIAAMVDVSDKQNPQLITTWQTPSAFTHNIWPSTDGHYAFTTDEVSSAYVTAYDISDPQNVVEVDRINHILSVGVIPHNTHYMSNGFLVTSNYRDGVTIADVTDPTNMITSGWYDTSPLEGDGFNGVWEAWPYLPSGNILAGDMEEGLFILGVDYVQAARLVGNVTDILTSAPLSNVSVTLVGPTTNTTTDIFGHYSTGYAVAGTYSLLLQKAGYLDLTLNGIVLTNGQTVVADAQMTPAQSFNQSFHVNDAFSGSPIAGAMVHVVNAQFDLASTTDASGNVLFDPFYAGQYEIQYASWGHVEGCVTVNIDLTTGNQTFTMEPGYADHFNFDLGWTTDGSATAGAWERGVPAGTSFNGAASNPGTDATGDCGTMAYVTGNGGGAAGDDDVDGGDAVLTSPVFDVSAGYTNPGIMVRTWFFNAGGSGAPNDALNYQLLANGTWGASNTVPAGEWDEMIIPISAGVTQIRFATADNEPGHLVEAGIDFFRIIEMESVADAQPIVWSMAPNPSTDGRIAVSLMDAVPATLTVTDAAGRRVGATYMLQPGTNAIDLGLRAGLYLIQVSRRGQTTVNRLVISGR
jgi:choice-of-anchor B domain-containing protein